LVLYEREGKDPETRLPVKTNRNILKSLEIKNTFHKVFAIYLYVISATLCHKMTTTVTHYTGGKRI
jgi:hypothetical protein